LYFTSQNKIMSRQKGWKKYYNKLQIATYQLKCIRTIIGPESS
jgi:hypothetical protein